MAAARKWAKLLDAEDRKLFFTLARNNPGASAPVKFPTRNGFLDLKACSHAEIVGHVKDVPVVGRFDMFNEVIGIVHRCSHQFAVYIGRTFLRTGEEWRGPKSRWKPEKHQFGRVLFKVPLSRIRRDETLGIALLGFWSEVRTADGKPALCCYNKALGDNGPLSADPHQLVYLCLSREQWEKKVFINHDLMTLLRSRTNAPGERGRGGSRIPPADRTRCEGKKDDGTRCTRLAKSGNKRCGHHWGRGR